MVAGTKGTRQFCIRVCVRSSHQPVATVRFPLLTDLSPSLKHLFLLDGCDFVFQDFTLVSVLL